MFKFKFQCSRAFDTSDLNKLQDFMIKIERDRVTQITNEKLMQNKSKLDEDLEEWKYKQPSSQQRKQRHKVYQYAYMQN